jgi:hypothetical protein
MLQRPPAEKQVRVVQAVAQATVLLLPTAALEVQVS